MSGYEYNAMTPDLAARLEQICGAAHVLYGKVGKLERYGRDQAADSRYAHLPEIVVKWFRTPTLNF